MAVSFFLKDKKKEKTSVDAIVRFKGERFKLATGESVLVDYWDPEKKRLCQKREYKEAANINLRLDNWENTLKRVCNKFAFEMKVPTKREFTLALNKELDNEVTAAGSFTAFVKEFIPRSGRDKSTIKGYKSTLKNILLFEKRFKQDLRFEDINLIFYKNFKQFCIDKEFSKNYFGTLIKNIKVFMDEAIEEKLHDSTEHRNKKFKTVSEPSDSIYLTEDELLKIHNLELTPELIKSLDQYKDTRAQNIGRKLESLDFARKKFLIGTYTALRVSDFNRLGEINLEEEFIRIKPKKGSLQRKNDDVIIPVHWIIKEIIESGFDFNKTISDQKINKHIKEVCQLAGIDNMISSSRTEGGELVESVNPKYKLVTTHTARRSGATNMFNAGIPSIRIMKITGHKTEKAFMKYIRISQEENAKVLANHPYFKKYGNMQEEKKYPDYDPATSEIPFEAVQDYRSVIVDHYNEHKTNSLKETNKGILKVFFSSFKKSGGTISEEQFIYEMQSSLKEVHPEIFEYLNKES